MELRVRDDASFVHTPFAIRPLSVHPSSRLQTIRVFVVESHRDAKMAYQDGRDGVIIRKHSTYNSTWSPSLPPFPSFFRVEIRSAVAHKPLHSQVSHHRLTYTTVARPSLSLSSFPFGSPRIAPKNQNPAAIQAAIMRPTAYSGAKMLIRMSITEGERFAVESRESVAA